MLSNAELAKLVPRWLGSYIAEPWRSTSVSRTSALLAEWTDEDWAEIRRIAAAVYREPRVYEASEVCRTLSRTYCRDLLADPHVEGAEHLDAALARGPTLVLCNHVSYIDANAVDALLAWSGRSDLADRLTVAVGPKVFEIPFRRLATAGIHAIPVPQPAGVSTRENMRDLAELARRSMEAAHGAALAGNIAFVFPEGSRSRTTQLGPFQRGMRRWLRLDGLQVVPAAIWGTEKVMPVSKEYDLEPHPTRLQLAPPLAVDVDGDATEILERSFWALAEMLPEDLKPEDDRPLT